jgi:hypothetical protein
MPTAARHLHAAAGRPGNLATVIAISLVAALLSFGPASHASPAGMALKFNGSNQYVTFGTAPALGLGTFTLETWFERTGSGVGTSTGSGGLTSAIPLISKGRTEGDGTNVDMNYFLGIDASTGTLVADFEEGPSTGGTVGLNHPVSGSTVVTLNRWHHAAATYDGQTWRLYLDGVRDGTLTLNTPRPPRSDSIQHAALATAMNSSGVASGFFDGMLDEARVWNVARTPTEIRSTKGLEVSSASGLIGRWGMNEGIGNVISDSSGSAVTGTAVAGPTWVSGFPPSPSDPVVNAPTDGQTGLGTSPTLDISVSDATGVPVTVTFRGRAKASGVFRTIATRPDVAAGSSTSATWADIGQGQVFEWFVTIDDGSSVTAGPIWTFKTADGPDPVLLGAGDVAMCDSSGDEATGAIVDGIDGTVFTAGDNVYVNGTAQEFNDCYDPSWGSFKARTRPTAGNHDWNTGNLNGYNGYYGSNATDAGGKSYYSYDLDVRWHVTVLDTECGRAAVGGCGSGSPQEVWLRGDLRAHSDDNVIVIWHKPRFSSGRQLTSLQTFYQDIYDAGVDILLVGHDHIYERLAPMAPTGSADPIYGVRQFTLGTGGAEHQSFNTILPTSEVRNNDTWGVMKLTLHDSTYDWMFLPVDGGNFTDSGTGVTHGPPPDQAPTFDQDLPDRTDAEGDAISLSSHAGDPNGDSLTYAASGLPPGLSINASTGLIAGTISAGGATGSPYAVTVTVSDDGGATVGATDTFSWSVVTAGGSGSILFRSASFAANSVGNNVVIPTPAGVQAGQVMIAVLDVKAAPTVTTPQGWTLVSTTPNGSNFKQVVYSRVVTASEPVSTTWTINENRAISGGIVAYSGVNTSAPVETFSAGTGSTGSIIAPSVTSAFGRALIIGAFGINADSTISPPPGMTERGEIVSAARIRTEISDVALTTAGATGTKTAAASTAAANIGQLIALRPA